MTVLYSYKMVMNKVDSGTNLAVGGVKFTIQNAAGAYLQADGSVDSTPYEFETASDGSFSVSGVDAGTYTFRETDAPSDYTIDSGASSASFSGTFTVDTLQLSSLSGTLTAANPGATYAHPELTGNANECTVTVKLVNDKKMILPMTGQAFIPFAVIVAIVVIVLLLLSKLRKKDDEEEGASGSEQASEE